MAVNNVSQTQYSNSTIALGVATTAIAAAAVVLGILTLHGQVPDFLNFGSIGAISSIAAGGGAIVVMISMIALIAYQRTGLSESEIEELTAHLNPNECIGLTERGFTPREFLYTLEFDLGNDQPTAYSRHANDMQRRFPVSLETLRARRDGVAQMKESLDFGTLQPCLRVGEFFRYRDNNSNNLEFMLRVNAAYYRTFDKQALYDHIKATMRDNPPREVLLTELLTRG